MNRTLCAALVSLLAVTVAPPALAQNATAKKVTLDLNGVVPAAAFKAVADAIGVTVNVDASVTDPVDIQVKNVSARTALTAMCESIGCQWRLEGGNLAIMPAKVDVKIAVASGDEAVTVFHTDPPFSKIVQSYSQATFVIIQYRQTWLLNANGNPGEVMQWMSGLEPAYRVERGGIPILDVYWNQ